MSEQDRYIPGVPCWIDLTPPDVDAAATFYAGLFGWELEDRVPAEVPAQYLYARIDGGAAAAIGTPIEGDQARTAWTAYVRVTDVEATLKQVWAAGGTVLTGPHDVPGQGRWARFADPEGAELALWQADALLGADVVNTHGSVNFNTLHTSDPAAAEAFYSAVFGWELLDIGGAHMWALPGYGDHLERREPGVIDRMRAMGAPDRFWDVVAAVGPREAGAPAEWGVTFGADDADAVAARAAELGATILQPPTDAPWTRTTVLRDPQGVVLTASQFVPPVPGEPEQHGAQAAA